MEDKIVYFETPGAGEHSSLFSETGWTAPCPSWASPRWSWPPREGTRPAMRWITTKGAKGTCA